MKIAYFDLIAGASGDMILGALLDAGLPEDVLRQRLAALKIADFEIQIRRVEKNGFSATKVDVLIADDAPRRHIGDIETIIRNSDLTEAIQDQAIAIFRNIGQVEADIHGTTLDQVHLHELSGLDTIVDVVGALVGLQALGVEKFYASPVPLGLGLAQGAHGTFPIPAPATLGLLEGVPVIGLDLDKELVTPTGAALLTHLVTDFGSIPAMKIEAVGYGAGGRDLPIPNVLRLLLGEQKDFADSQVESLLMLETNIDDMNPEIYEYVMQRLFDAGALDVFMAPIQMKKNRPGTTLSVLCREQDAPHLQNILFSETTTLGIRLLNVVRSSLRRSAQTVNTQFGQVRMKIAHLPDGQTKAAPEYEDCRRLALEHNLPIKVIYHQAMRNFENSS
jgi:pyridinium-3,5-bisthiocarboxylic acid mononucleotide nickel chelatase